MGDLNDNIRNPLMGLQRYIYNHKALFVFFGLLHVILFHKPLLTFRATFCIRFPDMFHFLLRRFSSDAKLKVVNSSCVAECLIHVIFIYLFII